MAVLYRRRRRQPRCPRRKEDPDGKFCMLSRTIYVGKFRALFLASMSSRYAHVDWAEQRSRMPVIDHWWQTETGWCIAGNPVGLGALRSSTAVRQW